jgi:hypothetical protein
MKLFLRPIRKESFWITEIMMSYRLCAHKLCRAQNKLQIEITYTGCRHI